MGKQSSGPRRYDHLRLGRHGEDLVARWYEDRGYEILDRNWRCPDGEIDLVVRLGPLVAVCEVKTRSSDRFGSPFEAVTRDKQRRVRRLAARWLATSSFRPTEVRLDAAAVVGMHVEVIEAAY